MENVFRTRLLTLSVLLMMMMSQTVKAAPETVRPLQFSLSNFLQTSVLAFKGNTTTVERLLNQIRNKKSNSVCVCEIMELRNNNQEVSNVAVFAEKTNYGSIGDEYKAAERQIRKERKQMKQLYYDKIITQERVAVANSCLSLYIKLIGYNPDLKVYDILNAD
ncbi:MAG TPA: hypothetical protein PKV73_12070 [Agriterribacter sp.]|nr:hypothetical protein [Chitinophagaceae bacterium]HRP32626.1 hypothetical protein [Agriterribacter sp.]